MSRIDVGILEAQGVINVSDIKREPDDSDEDKGDCTSFDGQCRAACAGPAVRQDRESKSSTGRISQEGALSNDHDNIPASGLGGSRRRRQNLAQRTRQYFGRPQNIISLLTLVAVVAYTSLTYELLNAERESYTRVQRAFVFPAEYTFSMERAARRIGVDAIWKNGGDTPTRNLHVSITEGRRESPLPVDFDFAADDKTKYVGRPLPILVLGPHASVVASRPANIPFSAISDINSGKEFAYLWGYARYDDVFGAHHLTRHCVQITSVEADLAGSNSSVTAGYIPCDRGNCADEECDAEKIPSP